VEVLRIGKTPRGGNFPQAAGIADLNGTLCKGFRPEEALGFADEGTAVGAFDDGRVFFVAADFDLVKRAVVFILAVIGAFGDGAADAFVCTNVHFYPSRLICYKFARNRREYVRGVLKKKSPHIFS
jgi:hypothetical protein